jgi:predicted phosphoribosyltransferase
VLVTLENQTKSPAFFAQRLALKLHAFKNSNSTVAASSPQALPIAVELARELKLPWQKHGCKPLIHPGNPNKTIGSITAGNVVLDDIALRMPEDYIHHQIILLQHAILAEGEAEPTCYNNRNVIILREEINNADEVTAMIDELKINEAASVILATPVINREALSSLEKRVSEVIYLEIQHHTGLWLNPYCF